MEQHFKDRYNELLKIKGSKRAKIGRGQEFEDLINDIFEREGILLKKGYHSSDNKSEQIDGVIEISGRIILVETKWVRKNIAASELYSFIGKVENKLSGTLGVFISKKKLSDNFVKSIVKGRKRRILLLHGEDIDILFNEDISLKKYFEYCIRKYSYDNTLHFSLRKWIENEKTKKDADESITEIEKINKEAIKEFLSKLVSGKLIQEHDLHFDLKELSISEKKEIGIFLLSKYPVYYKAYMGLSPKNSNVFSNVNVVLSIILKENNLAKELADKYYNFYNIKPDIAYLRPLLWDYFKKYLNSTSRPYIKDFEKSLLENFKKIFGSWDKENTITNVVKFIWDNISNDTKKEFMGLYLEIYFSSRSDKFEQKQFSYVVVENKNNSGHVKEWIENKIIDEINDNNIMQNDVENEVKYFCRTHSKVKSALSMSTEEWANYINKLYVQNIN